MNTTTKSAYILALCALPACGLFFWLRHGGAHKPATAAAAPAPPPVKMAPPPGPALNTDEEMAKAAVNEVGLVPILEYHEINDSQNSSPIKAVREMSRSVTRFRHDLSRLYGAGYRPITMREYLDNRIDLPLGRSPFILTFDDARASQLRYLADGSIDPECAVGILQAFHQAHPDFPLKATFFVLPKHPFGSSPAEADRKLRALQTMGFELENHTLNHRYFNHMSDAAICREIALGQAGIQRIVPNAHIDVLALPGGSMPRSRHRAILLAGEADGIHYTNRAILMAGADPAPAPASVRYKPWHIPRILAVEGESGVTYWLNYLDHHKAKRYISDGVADTISVPVSLAKQVDSGKLQGAHLHIYGAKSASAQKAKAATKGKKSRRHKKQGSTPSSSSATLSHY